ncbi:DUF2336 domain-containing protein [Parvularcula sp. IMCC14364]|uniref:DUF2336 domain-containing protein n=1 Tax=Parvularcula sp. IMCC14364 TaxID=3067902 RepID=UPI002740FDEB|nr:DUF2336 domain-containing protein [Parvularcula sp. IMCC14364]
MAARKSPLEALIDFPRDGDNETRRELLRINTDNFMTAADRYGSRRHEFFDLMFSRTSLKIDHFLRRVLAVTLARASADQRLARKMLGGNDRAVSLILRKSATQTVPDLLNMIRERSSIAFDAPRRPDLMAADMPDCNRFSMPPMMVEEIYRFIYFSLRHPFSKAGSPKLLALLDQTAKKYRQKILDEAQAETRAELVAASKAIDHKVRLNKLTEVYVSELLLTDSKTEFTLAMCALLNVDSATMQRILNDSSWEALAITCRAAGLSRPFFTNLVNSMNKRESDQHGNSRIVTLYNKITEDSATRVMRFWQVRASTLKSEAPAQDASPQDRIMPDSDFDDFQDEPQRMFGRG